MRALPCTERILGGNNVLLVQLSPRLGDQDAGVQAVDLLARRIIGGGLLQLGHQRQGLAIVWVGVGGIGQVGGAGQPCSEEPLRHRRPLRIVGDALDLEILQRGYLLGDGHATDGRPAIQ